MNFNRINPVKPSFLIVNAFGKSQIPNESLPKASRYEAGESTKLFSSHRRQTLSLYQPLRGCVQNFRAASRGSIGTKPLPNVVMRQSRKLSLKDRASDEAQQVGVNSVSKHIAVSTSEDDTPGRADEALTASTSSKPMLRFSLEIMMAALLMAASYVLHWVAHLIVTEYGLLGGVITCGALYVTALIMDHYNL